MLATSLVQAADLDEAEEHQKLAGTITALLRDLCTGDQALRSYQAL